MKRLSIILFLVVTFGIVSPDLQSQNNMGGEIATDRYGFEMIYVPSGTVQMGIDADLFAGLVTDGMFAEYTDDTYVSIQRSYGVFETYEVTLQGFWMDRYEVTINQYERLIQGCFEAETCSDSNIPQLLSWELAVQFCAIRGTRLPRETEWEYAASGPDNFIFPWGNELDLDLLENNIYSEFSLYEVGSKPINVSWIGIFDMAGNAEEWTDDLFQPYYSWDETSLTNWYAVNPEFLRVVRGGASEDSILSKTTYWRDGEFYNMAGLRCVRIGDPRDG